jgi:hypothetical protein
MDGLARLLSEARSAGLIVRREGEQLVVRGPKHEEGLATALLSRKADVLALLVTDEQAIQDRMAVLRPLVPATGPIPFLLVRSQEEVPTGCCLSCGDALGPRDRVRCRRCVEAVQRVLAEVAAKRRSMGGAS